MNIVVRFILRFLSFRAALPSGDDPSAFHDAGVESTPVPNVMVMRRPLGELFNAEQKLEECLAAF